MRCNERRPVRLSASGASSTSQRAGEVTHSPKRNSRRYLRRRHRDWICGGRATPHRAHAFRGEFLAALSPDARRTIGHGRQVDHQPRGIMLPANLERGLEVWDDEDLGRRPQSDQPLQPNGLSDANEKFIGRSRTLRPAPSSPGRKSMRRFKMVASEHGLSSANLHPSYAYEPEIRSVHFLSPPGRRHSVPQLSRIAPQAPQNRGSDSRGGRTETRGSELDLALERTNEAVQTSSKCKVKLRPLDARGGGTCPLPARPAGARRPSPTSVTSGGRASKTDTTSVLDAFAQGEGRSLRRWWDLAGFSRWTKRGRWAVRV